MKLRLLRRQSYRTKNIHETLDTFLLQFDYQVLLLKYDKYINLIVEMYSNFLSDVFAKPKDDCFHSLKVRLGKVISTKYNAP